MFKLGIIGTGAISHEFIQAAHLSQAFQLAAVYSRRMETAASFAQNYSDVRLFDDIQAFLASDLDVIYIASPNSLHFPQAKQVLAAGKHAIVEKPAVTNPAQWQELTRLAQAQQVYVLEAARNYHEQAFTVISDFLADKTVLGGHFSYAKYSSKMPDLLAGKEPNVFSSRFAGGALMDLGIYPIQAAVRLFGKPDTAFYKAQQLENSIDLNGSGQLHYSNFSISILTGKNIDSHLPAEIYTDQGTLILSGIEAIESALFHSYDGQVLPLPISKNSHRMLEEVQVFAAILRGEQPDLYQTLLADSLSVHQTIYSMRQTASITFEEDHHA